MLQIVTAAVIAHLTTATVTKETVTVQTVTKELTKTKNGGKIVWGSMAFFNL